MRTERRQVANPEALSERAARKREQSKLRMRKYRERLRAEARIQAQMRRWGIDRERAVRQVTQRPRTAEEVAEDRRCRLRGDFDRDPRYPSRWSRDLRRTRRPRGTQRRPGATPEAARRRLKVREYRRRRWIVERQLAREPHDEY